MRLRFTARARRHLNDIQSYISEQNPRAALAVGKRLREVTEILGHLPYLGRGGALAGTREMVVPSLPYVIVYQVREREALSSSSALSRGTTKTRIRGPQTGKARRAVSVTRSSSLRLTPVAACTDMPSSTVER